MEARIVIRRYWHRMVVYWTGIGWSNTGARAKTFDSLSVATVEAVLVGGDAGAIASGPNLRRSFYRK